MSLKEEISNLRSRVDQLEVELALLVPIVTKTFVFITSYSVDA
jgi:hypothetical protein